MMSEVTPRGYENMFFGLFGITNRAVSAPLPFLFHVSPFSSIFFLYLHGTARG